MDFAHNNNFSAKKAGGIGLTILMHALLACALVYGLHSTFAPKSLTPEAITPYTEPPQPKTPPTESSKPASPTLLTPTITLPPLPPIDVSPPTTITPPSEPDGATNDGRPTTGTGTGYGFVGKGLTKAASFDLNGCKPVYPRSAELANETGVVRLRFEIGADSRLINAAVLRSSGYAVLDKAAQAALSRCTFKAAMQDDSPVSSSFTVDYAWTLDNE
jgi:protein TonB